MIRPTPPAGYDSEDDDSDDDEVEIIDGNTSPSGDLVDLPSNISGFYQDVSTDSESEDLVEDLFNKGDQSPFDNAGKSLFGSEGYSTDESDETVESTEGKDSLVDEIVDELLNACKGKGKGREDGDERNVGTSEDLGKVTKYTVSAKSICSEDEETDDESTKDDSSATLGDTDSYTEDSDDEDGETDSDQADTEDDISSVGAVAQADFLGAGVTAMVHRPLKRQMGVDDMASEYRREIKRLKGDHPSLRTSVSQGTIFVCSYVLTSD